MAEVLRLARKADVFANVTNDYKTNDYILRRGRRRGRGK